MDLFCAAAFSAALSIDALAIGISCAARGVRIPAAARLVVCFVSAVITAAAVLSGGALSAVVPGSAARAFGAALLFFLGIYIIIGAFKKDSEKDGPSVCTRSSTRCGTIRGQLCCRLRRRDRRRRTGGTRFLRHIPACPSVFRRACRTTLYQKSKTRRAHSDGLVGGTTDNYCRNTAFLKRVTGCRLYRDRA